MPMHLLGPLPPSDPVPTAGETWAYRAQARTATCPLLPVAVLAVGTGRNRGILVCFLAGDEEGEERRVPPARLLVPWAERETWLRDEAALVAATAASRVDWRDPVRQAVSLVLAASPRPGGIRLGSGREGAIVRVPDLAELARDLGLDADRLLQEPLAFVDRHGAYVAPWAVTLGLARGIAPVYAERILTVMAEEATWLRHEALFGATTVLRDGSTHTVPAEEGASFLGWQEPVFALVGSWCGGPAVARFDRVAKLEAEVVRLRALLEAEGKLPPGW